MDLVGCCGIGLLFEGCFAKSSAYLMLMLGLNNMFKFLGWILKFFLSILLSFAIGISSVFITPYFAAERYEYNETPHGLFTVFVETIDNENNQKSVEAVRWREYSEKINDYKAYRSPSEGKCDNAPLWCQAKNIEPGKQLIELRDRQENFFLYNKYYVTNEKIIPLYCRIMDPGHAMLGFFISIIAFPIVLVSFPFFKKRFKKIKAKSNDAAASS